MARVSLICCVMGFLGAAAMLLLRDEVEQMGRANAGLGSLDVMFYLLLWCALCLMESSSGKHCGFPKAQPRDGHHGNGSWGIASRLIAGKGYTRTVGDRTRMVA